MAIKDWKKSRTGWKNISPQSLKERLDILKIGSGKYGWDAYGVRLKEYGDYKTLATFKTKSQAMNYAMSYMKKH